MHASDLGARLFFLLLLFASARALRLYRSLKTKSFALSKQSVVDFIMMS
jgi:hypothetical protein